MFDWSIKPPKVTYNYYCGSCGCKYINRPSATRSACSANCYACGSSRIIRYEWATDDEEK